MTRHFSESNRHLCEAGNSPLGCAVCPAGGLLSASRVLSSRGWVAARQVRRGDEVLTFDNGFVPVAGVDWTWSFSSIVPCPMHFWPLRVPAGLLGNVEDFMVLPDNSVLFEYESGGDVVSVAIPSRALMGRGGVQPTDPMKRQRVIQLHFEQPQLVAIENGAYQLFAGGELITEAD